MEAAVLVACSVVAITEVATTNAPVCISLGQRNTQGSTGWRSQKKSVFCNSQVSLETQEIPVHEFSVRIYCGF